MSDHTPGPWQIHARRYIIATADDIAIADVGNWIPAGQEMDANARLIAAAPDLLAACQQGGVYPDLKEPCSGPNLLRQAAKTLDGPGWTWLRNALYAKAAAEDAAIKRATEG